MKFEVEDEVGNVWTSGELGVSIDGDAPSYSGFSGSGHWLKSGSRVTIRVTVSIEQEM